MIVFVAPPIAGVAAGIYTESAAMAAAVAATPTLVYAATTQNPFARNRMKTSFTVASAHAIMAAGITAVVT